MQVKTQEVFQAKTKAKFFLLNWAPAARGREQRRRGAGRDSGLFPVRHLTVRDSVLDGLCRARKSGKIVEEASHDDQQQYRSDHVTITCTVMDAHWALLEGSIGAIGAPGGVFNTPKKPAYAARF